MELLRKLWKKLNPPKPHKYKLGEDFEYYEDPIKAYTYELLCAVKILKGPYKGGIFTFGNFRVYNENDGENKFTYETFTIFRAEGIGKSNFARDDEFAEHSRDILIEIIANSLQNYQQLRGEVLADITEDTPFVGELEEPFEAAGKKRKAKHEESRTDRSQEPAKE